MSGSLDVLKAAVSKETHAHYAGEFSNGGASGKTADGARQSSANAAAQSSKASEVSAKAPNLDLTKPHTPESLRENGMAHARAASAQEESAARSEKPKTSKPKTSKSVGLIEAVGKVLEGEPVKEVLKETHAHYAGEFSSALGAYHTKMANSHTEARSDKPASKGGNVDTIQKDMHPLVQEDAVVKTTKTILSEVRELLGGYGDKKPNVLAAMTLLSRASEVLATAPSAQGATSSPSPNDQTKRIASFANPQQFTVWADSQFKASKSESGLKLSKRMSNLGKAFALAKAHWDDEAQKLPLTIEMESYFVGLPGTASDLTARSDQSSTEVSTPPSPTMKSEGVDALTIAFQRASNPQPKSFAWPMDMAAKDELVQKNEEGWGSDPEFLK